MSAMKKVALGMAAALITSTAVMSTAVASEARSEKHAKQATELRQSVFKLLASNIGPMGQWPVVKCQWIKRLSRKTQRVLISYQ